MSFNCFLASYFWWKVKCWWYCSYPVCDELFFSCFQDFLWKSLLFGCLTMISLDLIHFVFFIFGVLLTFGIFRLMYFMKFGAFLAILQVIFCVFFLYTPYCHLLEFPLHLCWDSWHPSGPWGSVPFFRPVFLSRIGYF